MQQDIKTLIREWNTKKAAIALLEKEADSLKHALGKALGTENALPVRLSDTDKGVWVVQRVRQDRRKPDLHMLTEYVCKNHLVNAHVWEEVSNTMLTEDGTATLLERGVISQEVFARCLSGKVVEYVEVRFKADVQEDA